MIVPDAYPTECAPSAAARVRHYPGIKEDVYVPGFEPDPSFSDAFGPRTDDIVITVRPPADEAHYRNPESDVLMEEFMSRARSMRGVRIILLPRNSHQKEHFEKAHPEWFREPAAVVPSRVHDGLNILWHSDLVVSGGGTMNREAAALGVPVYSIFRGQTGAVDLMLEREGRLTMIRSREEVWSKIRIEKRTMTAAPDRRERPALGRILYHIESIIEIERAKRIRVRKAKPDRRNGR
jgi:hypothetical protein